MVFEGKMHVVTAIKISLGSAHDLSISWASVFMYVHKCVYV